MHISPERTSFFGFFSEQEELNKKPISNTKPLKRNFESSQSPKREIAQAAYRNLTPFTINQKSDFIDLLPRNEDSNYANEECDSPYIKNTKISPRKEHHSKYLDYQQSARNSF